MPLAAEKQFLIRKTRMYINSKKTFATIGFDDGLKRLPKSEDGYIIVSIRDIADENDVENIMADFRNELLLHEDMKAIPIVNTYRDRKDAYNGPLGYIVASEYRKDIENIIGNLKDKEHYAILKPQDYTPPKNAYLLSFKNSCPWEK